MDTHSCAGAAGIFTVLLYKAVGERVTAWLDLGYPRMEGDR